MRKGVAVHDEVDPDKTRTAVQHAIGEVQHAARHGRRSGSGLLSWLVALTAGTAVAWRSLNAPKNLDTSSAETPPLVLDPGGREQDSRDPNGSRSRAPGKRKETVRHDDRHAAGKSRAAVAQARDKDEAAECPPKAEGFGEWAKELWCRFQTAECLTRSQALAFIGILSLGPVLLFALAALGFVIHDTAQVERFVHDLVGQLLPGRQASEAANSLIAQTHIMDSARSLMNGKWWAVSIGVVSLIWTAIGLFVGASDPMNASWNVKETRGFIKLRAIALAVFLGAGILFLCSLVPSSLPSLIGRIQLPVLGSIPPGMWWVDVLGWLLAIAVNAAMFTVIYRFLPNAPVTWKSALFGGVVAGLLWELFKKGFAVYLAHFGDYNKLYGALGGAVLLVTWIWYTCVLLLVGAILCKMYHEHAEEGGVIRTGAKQPTAA